MLFSTSKIVLSAYLTFPPVGGVNPKIVFPIVDFPHPDSPTSPNMVFSFIAKLTSSTDLTYFFSLEKDFFLTG